MVVISAFLARLKMCIMHWHTSSWSLQHSNMKDDLRIMIGEITQWWIDDQSMTVNIMSQGSSILLATHVYYTCFCEGDRLGHGTPKFWFDHIVTDRWSMIDNPSSTYKYHFLSLHTTCSSHIMIRSYRGFSQMTTFGFSFQCRCTVGIMTLSGLNGTSCLTLMLEVRCHGWPAWICVKVFQLEEHW